VDLHATKGQHGVVVEIETGKSDISANIKKCKDLPGTVVFFFLTTELRDAWQNAIPQGAVALTSAELNQFTALLR
jgi:hypothetical protein